MRSIRMSLCIGFLASILLSCVGSAEFSDANAQKGSSTNPPSSGGAPVAPNQISNLSFSPAAGAYTSAQSIVISSTTPGITIRYTTDGSTPSSSNGSDYSTALPISQSTTVRAFATKSGMLDSNQALATYSLNLPPGQVVTPVISVPSGTYNTRQTITLSTTTPGATISYTLNGTIPTSTNGFVYTTPIQISQNTSLSAMAFKSGMTDSTIASTSYAFTLATSIWTLHYTWVCGAAPGSYSITATINPSSAFSFGNDTAWTWTMSGNSVTIQYNTGCRTQYIGTINSAMDYISGYMIDGGNGCICDSGNSFYMDNRH